MLKYFLIVSMFLLIAPATFARTNAEIKQQLYKTADIIQKETPIHSLRQKENINSFILELEMLNFNESSAIWKELSTNYVYDEKQNQFK